MIKDYDNTKKLISELKKINKTIRVGYLGDAEMVKIGVINEFGAVIKSEKAKRYLFAKMREAGIPIQSRGKGFLSPIIIPERSHIRSTFDSKQSMNTVFNSAKKSWEHGSIENVINVIGVTAASEIQEKIASNIPPKNHPYTTFAKGGKNTTLIAGGRLRQSVSYEVE